jgi:hypothetical protein
MTKIINSFPAYDIVEPTFDSCGNIPLVAGQVIIVGGRKFSVGSVVSYMLKSGMDPVAAVQRAIENGHALVWLNPEATMLTAEKRAKTTHVAVNFQQRVRFEGVTYKIEIAANNNLEMVRVD